VDWIPTLRKGDPKHVQGFILYKLWLGHCWARGGRHHKHIDLENDLPTNYDKRFRSVILSEARALHTRSLVTIFKSEGRDAISAVLSEGCIQTGLPIVNVYLKAVGEEPLEGTIREIITGKRSARKGPLTPDELRKYARMHRQGEK
jgi:hypothetical protein